VLVDIRGARRSPASTPGFKPRRPPSTKGRKYEPHPFTTSELQALFDACVAQREGQAAELSALRLRAIMAVLYRTGLRISELLALEPRDLNLAERKVVVRHGKGDKRRVARMDNWGWGQLQPWLLAREALPIGAIFCVITGVTAGRPLHDSDVRRQLRDLGIAAGLHRRVNAHAWRHTFAVELRREGMDIITISRALGHSSVNTTMLYLRSLGEDEILDVVAERRGPMVPLT
jgi:integrase/recombinase XerD